MILVHDMQGEELYVNPDRIESMSARPDTVLFLVNGKRIVIQDSPEQVINSIIAFRQRQMSELLLLQEPNVAGRLPVIGE